MAKFFFSLLVLLYISLDVATSSPTSFQKRAPPPFQIDNFAASGYPVPIQGQYLSYVQHNVTLKPDESSIYCYAWASTSDLSIADITYPTACKGDNSITWSFEHQSDGGYNFTVAWAFTGHGKLIGSTIIPEFQVQWITVDAGQDDGVGVQQYVGPPSFSMDVKEVDNLF